MPARNGRQRRTRPGARRTSPARAARLRLDERASPLGDGRAGYPEEAPFERIVVTAGARRIAPSWIAQLAEGGRIVFPLVDERGDGRVLVHEKVAGSLVAGDSHPCRFLPLR